MKRDGWQHGMVRFNPKSAKHHLESEPAAAEAEAEAVAFRSKLLPKPTSNSKFTGKCRKARCKSCHYHPVSKSKDKAKGSYKLKSCDVALNHRLVSWRLVDEGRPAGLNVGGVSATALLGSLSSNSWHEEDKEEEEEAEFAVGCSYENEEGFYGHEYGSVESAVESDDKIVESSNDKEEEEEEDDMGFLMVGFTWEFSDGEDWLVVEEN